MPSWLTTLIAQIETVTPAGWTAIGIAVLLFALYAFVSVRRRLALKAGTSVDKADRLLLTFALAFVAVIFGSFMIGTFEGSSAFGIDKLGWTNWQRAVPWGSLDAGSIGFSLLAIRAIRKERSPKPALRVVFLTAGMSATIQMMEGGKEHHWQAGLFLAFLAGVSAYALHIVIDQLRKVGHVAIDVRVRKYPPFAMRWLTSMPSTLCAWLAWVNYPPVRITPTVVNALAHLESVRAAKRARMTERPIWWFVQPWLYASRIVADVERLSSALDANRTEATVESVRVAERISELNRELNSARELVAERERTEQNLLAQFAAERTEAERTNRTEAERAELTISALRTEVAELSARRTEPINPRRSEPPVNRTKSQSVGTLVSDAEIANRLQGWFGEQTEATGKQPTRYRIELTAPCSSRQADRVLILLANRYDELKSEPNGTVNRGGREPNRTGEPTADDLDHELIELTG
jgi:TRAP-type C4-dicarboxylate transport system permease small subunit